MQTACSWFAAVLYKVKLQKDVGAGLAEIVFATGLPGDSTKVIFQMDVEMGPWQTALRWFPYCHGPISEPFHPSARAGRRRFATFKVI